MIYLGIPTYNGQIHHTTVAGLCQVSRHCGKAGMGIALDVVPHDAFIDRARNLLVKRFLASPATDLIFIDADVGFALDDFAKLCRPDVDISMGLYCVKDDKGKIYDLFPCGRKGNAFLGEDISFCQRAKECGFDIWAVQGTNLLHSGEKTWPAKWQLDVQVSA